MRCGDKITLSYTSGRTTEATVGLDPETAQAGKSVYLLGDDGGFQRMRVAADGGTVLEVSKTLGTWSPS